MASVLREDEQFDGSSKFNRTDRASKEHDHCDVLDELTASSTRRHNEGECRRIRSTSPTYKDLVLRSADHQRTRTEDKARPRAGFEGPTALHRQRGKPTRGDGPCEATTRAEVKNPNSFVTFQGFPTSKYPAPLFVDTLMHCQPCVKHKRPRDDHKQRSSPRPGELEPVAPVGGEGGRCPPPLPTYRPQ